MSSIYYVTGVFFSFQTPARPPLFYNHSSIVLQLFFDQPSKNN